MNKLIPFIPRHFRYVEVFGVHRTLLFNKKTSPIEIFNDTHGGLCHFYRMMRDEESFDKLSELIFEAPTMLVNPTKWYVEKDDIKKAYAWYLMQRGPAATLGNLPGVHSRLLRTQVEHVDFRKCFEIYDGDDAFFFCDPPPVQDTPAKFISEMDADGAVSLIELLCNMKGNGMLYTQESCYDAMVDFGWTCHIWQKDRVFYQKKRGV